MMKLKIYGVLFLLLGTFVRNAKSEALDIVIAEKVAKHFIRLKKPEKLDWNWEEAIGLHGLSLISPYLDDQLQSKIYDYINQYHHYWDKKKPHISWADECPSALSALHLGSEYYDRSDVNFYNVINYLKNAELNEIGAIDHLGENSFISRIFKPYKNSVWLDSLMMWGNLSLRYGVLKQDSQLIDLALSIPKIFSSYMQDMDTGMFIHSYNYGGDFTYPRQKLFWTRGNGWVVATLADYLELMPRDDYRYEEIKNIFINLVEGFKNAERKDGVWRNLYPVNKDNRIDTSGSSLITYGMLKGVRLGILDKEYVKLSNDVYISINKYLKETRNNLRLTRVIGPTSPGPRIFYLVIPYQKNSYYGHGAYFMMMSEILKL